MRIQTIKTIFFSLLVLMSPSVFAEEIGEKPKSFKDTYSLFFHGGFTTGSDTYYTSLGGHYGIYNAAIDHKQLRDKEIYNAYVGMGVEDSMQFQFGYGTISSLIMRVQGAWSFREIAEQKMALTHRPLTFADRLLVTFGGEHYFTERDYTHIYVGLGFRFL